MPSGGSDQRTFVVVGVGSRVLALPIDDVEETMRPLRIEPVAGAPACVAGVAVIRGAPVPVVALGTLLGMDSGRPARFVTMKIGTRRVAVAVDRVHGVQRLMASPVQQVAPLLGGVDRAAIDALATADGQLVVVLDAARVLPEGAWKQLDSLA